MIGADSRLERPAERIQADDPQSRLTWEIALKSGEEKTVTYRYKIWLRV